MLSSLLTIIISYNPRISSTNKEYHNTFICKDEIVDEIAPMALCHCSSGRIMYNWRHKKISYGSIYNKYEVSISSLPTNYY